MTIPHKSYQVALGNDSDEPNQPMGRALDPRGNCWSSEIDDSYSGLHAPILDIDYEARLVPSATPGHFHLYLDKALTWEQYERVLTVLGEVGLIEQGFGAASIRRRASFLRKEGVAK